MNFKLKDTDNDGYIDILDCRPRNKRKQGVLHSAGAFVARKLGDEERAKRFEEAGARRDAEKEEERKLYAQAKAEANKKVMEARVQQRVARIEAKAERIRTAPERRAAKQAAIKEKVRGLYSSVGQAAKNYATQKKSPSGEKPKNSMTFASVGNNMMGSLGGGMNFGNLMAEFAPKKGKKRKQPQLMQPMKFGNPMAEFSSGKRKKIKNNGFGWY